MQGIGWCDMGMGFLCVSGCSAVWVEIGAECVARESGVGWRIFANFGGIVATSLAFRAEMLASRGSLCVTLHHRNATTPSGPASPSNPAKPIIGTPQPYQTLQAPAKPSSPTPSQISPSNSSHEQSPTTPLPPPSPTSSCKLQEPQQNPFFLPNVLRLIK